MLAEISHYILIVASLCAVIFAAPILWGVHKGHEVLADLWKPAMGITFVGLTLALILLGWAFLNNDFSIAYVANNSNTQLSPVYKISAIWASHEGSILFWVWTISAWGALFGIFSANDENLKSRIAGILLAVIGLICLFIIFTSNPFERVLPLVPPEGKDLNPILQDVGMIMHPPMLFLGYAGAAICFAFSLASLLEGKVRSESLRSLTAVTVITWGFLTTGNVLGSWWAYNELGWGGWWFWDPVENSSFVPWLLLTAQLHALVLLRYKEHLTKTALFLCLAAFSLCLLGTFIVRSGVIQSIHAFASDPNRGTFLLVISMLMIIPGFLIFAYRAPKFEEGKSISEVEDIALVLSVLLFCIAAFSILFGSLYPMIHDGLGQGALSVGAPYFNSIFAPMAILSALLIGMVQLRGSPIWWWALVFIASAVASIYFGFFTTAKSEVFTTGGVFGGLWIFLSALGALVFKARKNYFALISHLGVAVCIFGVVGDTQFSQEAVVRMGPGQGREVSNVVFVYEKTTKVDKPSYYADEGEILVLDKKDQVLDTVYPQRQTYKTNGMEMTAAGISHGFFRDFYVSIGNKLSPSEYLVKISVRPLVSWIWAGGIFMLFSILFSSIWRRKAWSKA